jgi:inorganic pyrophosphatase
MIQVCIEVAAGSCERHRYNEQTLEHLGTRRASRPYPYPYGFILGTRAADGASVDCYIITNASRPAGTLVECEPIGLLEQDEDGEVDHKVLAALPGQHIELGQGLLQELRDFIYAVFTPGHVQVGRMLPRQAALQHMQACREA